MADWGLGRRRAVVMARVDGRAALGRRRGARHRKRGLREGIVAVPVLSEAAQTLVMQLLKVVMLHGDFA